jgi:hypothetical protein
MLLDSHARHTRAIDIAGCTLEAGAGTSTATVALLFTNPHLCAALQGGAIFVSSGNLTLTNCSFANNTAVHNFRV